MVLGELYEVHGIRSTAALYTTHAAGSVFLLLLLANSGFPCTISYYAEWLMLAYAHAVAVLIAVLIAVLAGVVAVVGLLH